MRAKATSKKAVKSLIRVVQYLINAVITRENGISNADDSAWIVCYSHSRRRYIQLWTRSRSLP